MRILIAAIFAIAALALPASASAVTYYVSPTGSDSNNGTSEASPWRTVAKVNAAPLNGCDFVRFKRGGSFTDADLAPTRSGTTSCYITYSSYGDLAQPRPKLRKIFLAGADNMTLANMNLTGSGITGGNAILASSSADTDNITINNMEIWNWSIGINSANQGNQGWRIGEGVSVDNTGDSGMILLGDSFTIFKSNITNIGKNTGITYGKHGIYLKVSNATVSQNNIHNGANGQAVSARFRSSRILNNDLRGHPLGIGYFECDSLVGTSDWSGNYIQSNSTGIYVSGSDSSCGGTKQTSETFYIDDNDIDHGNQCMNLVNNGIAVYRVGTITPNRCF